MPLIIRLVFVGAVLSSGKSSGITGNRKWMPSRDSLVSLSSVECRGLGTLYGSLVAMRPDSTSGLSWSFTCSGRKKNHPLSLLSPLHVISRNAIHFFHDVHQLFLYMVWHFTSGLLLDGQFITEMLLSYDIGVTKGMTCVSHVAQMKISVDDKSRILQALKHLVSFPPNVSFHTKDSEMMGFSSSAFNKSYSRN